MDKKTLIINIFLVVLICIVGFCFGSYLIHNSANETEHMDEELPDGFEMQMVINKKVFQYKVFLEIFDNKLDHPFFYSGSINLNQNKYLFLNNETEEYVSNVRKIDLYSFFQSYLHADKEQVDNISISLEESDVLSFNSFLQSLDNRLNYPSKKAICEISVDEEAVFLSYIYCSLGDMQVEIIFENFNTK